MPHNMWSGLALHLKALKGLENLALLGLDLPPTCGKIKVGGASQLFRLRPEAKKEREREGRGFETQERLPSFGTAHSFLPSH